MDEPTQPRVTPIEGAIDGETGYLTGLRLQPDELARVTQLIERQWLDRLRRTASQHASEIERRGLARYHEIAHLIDHGTLWPKRERILAAEAVAEIRRMSLLRQLEQAFGSFAISDEDDVGHEEIYWRLVRPNEPTDVGPLHADAWFWELGHGSTAAGLRRVKMWVAVVTEPGRNGLRVVPGSHRREWRYHGEQRHGMVKPQLDEREEDLDIRLIPTEPGDAVVFHDRLLHGGALNQGEMTRVSFELTMFVPDRQRLRDSEQPG